LNNRAWVTDIRGAPTVQVIMEYLRVWELMEGVQLQQAVDDRFCWRFSADGVYSASSAYKAMFIGSTRLRGAKELWKTSAPPKIKFFF
jgi:hypothetical protein